MEKKPHRHTRASLETAVWRYFILGISVTISGAVLFWFDSLWWKVTALAIPSFTAFLLGRLELLHPYTWYIPPFFLYSASVPSLVAAGVRPDRGSLHETAVTQWIALAVFLFAVGARHRPSTRLYRKPLPPVHTSSTIIYGTFFGLSGLYMFGIWSLGLTTKYAIAASSSPFLRLNAAFSLMTFAFAVLLADAFSRRSIPWWLIASTLGWIAIAFVYSGERALLFRVLWVVLFLFHALYRRLSAGELTAVAACGLLLVSFLAHYKATHLEEEDMRVSATSPTIDAAFVTSIIFPDEFVTASENLQTLIEGSPWPPFFGETLWWDLRQTLLVGVRVGPAPTSVYNNHFFPEVVERGGGRGFTLVGEGYMNFRLAGAALWYLLLGLFVRFLYRKSARNTMWLVIYIMMMPIIVYATRADFSNIISPFAKHMLLPAIVIVMGGRILCRRRRRSTRIIPA